MTEKSILQEAFDTINGARQEDYGTKLQSFAQIAMGWQFVLARKLAPGAAITPEDVAYCMVQLKIARQAHSPDHRDSLVDAAGYVGCVGDLRAERARGAKLLGATVDAGAASVHSIG